MKRSAALIVLLGLTAPVAAHSAASVTTWHNDLARTGQNTVETVLTPGALRGGAFGRVCRLRVDGQIYAQPLYLPRVDIGGRFHSVVFVATEHDSVYAFDADCSVRLPLWQTSFLSKGVTTMPCTSAKQPQCDPTVMAPEHGVTATPVIDESTGTLYVAAQSVEHGTYAQRLHALDIRTGAERAGGPVSITARAPDNPKKALDPTQAFQRSGLLLLGGAVYVPLASNDSANGWLIGFDAANLARRGVFCVTPTTNLGGIWSGGAAPAVDGGGSIYVVTGNGGFDADTGGANYGMSALRLSAAAHALKVDDYFTPSHEAKLSHKDVDFGSGGIMLTPDQPGAHPHEAFIGFKTGTLFVLDRDRMGHRGDANAVQHLTVNPGGVYTSPAYWQGSVYLAGVGGHLTQWSLVDGQLPANPTHESEVLFQYPGATPSISSNGAVDGVVWAIATQGKVRGGPPAILRAFDARDVSVKLYDSNAAGSRDLAGPGVKFSVPTVADGKVFVGAQGELDIYGLKG